MTNVTYAVVEHDGGWAYRVDGVFSETFRSREEAHAAAETAAREQTRPGDDEVIEYEDAEGRWKVENAPGQDRPAVDVKD